MDYRAPLFPFKAIEYKTMNQSSMRFFLHNVELLKFIRILSWFFPSKQLYQQKSFKSWFFCLRSFVGEVLILGWHKVSLEKGDKSFTV